MVAVACGGGETKRTGSFGDLLAFGLSLASPGCGLAGGVSKPVDWPTECSSGSGAVRCFPSSGGGAARCLPKLLDDRPADGVGSACGGRSESLRFADDFRSGPATARRSHSSLPSALDSLSSPLLSPFQPPLRSLRGSLGSTMTTRSTGPGRDAARLAIRHPSSSSLSFGGVSWKANRRYRMVEVVVGGDRDDDDGREEPLGRSGRFHGVNGQGVDGPAAALAPAVLRSSSPSGAGVDWNRGRRRCRFKGVYVSRAWPGAILRESGLLSVHYFHEVIVVDGGARYADDLHL